MAKDFSIEGSALVITEGGTVIFESPKRDVYFDSSALENDAKVVLYDTNGTNKNASGIFSADLSECTDGGTPFTNASFRTFGRDSLGFSQGGGSPSGDVSIDSWIYKNSDYTVSTTSLDLKAVSMPVTVSDNVTLLGSTTTKSAHDGTNFKFTEGEIISIKFNIFAEINVSGNMVIVQILEGANVLGEGNFDTTKKVDAEHSISFTDLIITNSMATNGIDIKITDRITTGIYLDVYEIYFSITKKGDII